MTKVCNILEPSRSCRNIHCSYQPDQPGKTTLQVSVLMIEYLVATSYELWIKSCMLYSVALMTVEAEIVIVVKGII